MDLADLLKPTQQGQLAQELTRIMSRGFGVLELRVEQGRIRWLHPGSYTYSPLSTMRTDLAPKSTLTEIFGPWLEPFLSELAKVMGDAFGSLAIGIEHGSIHYILSSSDVRFRTGKTGEVNTTGLQK